MIFLGSWFLSSSFVEIIYVVMICFMVRVRLVFLLVVVLMMRLEGIRCEKRWKVCVMLFRFVRRMMLDRRKEIVCVYVNWLSFGF